MRLMIDCPSSLNLRSIIGNLKTAANRSLNESGKIIAANIKKELRDPNKSGTKKTSVRSRLSPIRRSAAGESLARDTGASERLVKYTKEGSTKMKVGFLENPHGFDYVAYQEKERDRPTVKKAVANSLFSIESVFDKNFKPKG